MNFRQRFCNALAIEHKYSDSLPIDQAFNYKRESTKNPRYAQLQTNTLRKSLSTLFLSNSKNLSSLLTKASEAIWLMPHRRVILPPSSFCRFSINGDDDPIHNIVHSLQRGDQLLIFYIINYYYFFHTLSLCGRALHTLSLSLSLSKLLSLSLNSLFTTRQTQLQPNLGEE